LKFESLLGIVVVRFTNLILHLRVETWPRFPDEWAEVG
jgi:hypothetical protein